MSAGKLIAPAMLFALIAACGGGGGGGDPVLGPVPIARITVMPPTPALVVGTTVQMSAVLYDRDGGVINGRAVQWSSNNTTVATVSATGMVTAVATGPARITATSGNVQGSTDVAVSPAPPASVDHVEISSTSTTVEEGATQQYTATAYDVHGQVITGRAVTWTSENSGIATVDAAGMVTGLRPGVTSVTARVDNRLDTAPVTVEAHYDFELVYGRYAAGAAPVVMALDIRDPAATPRQINPVATPAQQAAPSPDGLRIAYVVSDPAGTSVHVANSDGSNPVVIFQDGNYNDQPAWSPDGTRIAIRHRDPLNGTDILVVDSADGGNPVNVTLVHGATSQASPAWSPVMPDNSQWIAYSHAASGAAQIWAVRPDGTGTRQVTTNMDVYDDQPSWSPDGQRIVFQRSGDAIFGDLYVVSAAGGNGGLLMQLAGPLAGGQFAPAWSPDGQLIAFSSRHAGNYYQIYTVWHDGTRLAQRTMDDADLDVPRWMMLNP